MTENNPESTGFPDPEEGSRNWNMLVKIEGLIRDDAPLGWRTDSGERPTDEYLFAAGYAGYSEEPKPSVNELTHRVEALPLAVEGAEVVKRWSVVALDSAEQAEALTAHKARLVEYARTKRREVEEGGTVFNGLPVATDRESQAMVTGAYLLAQRDPQRTLQWQTEAGFVTLDAVAVTALADAIADHVQACFDTLAALVSDIADGTVSEVAQIDSAGWPPNI